LSGKDNTENAYFAELGAHGKNYNIFLSWYDVYHA